MVVLLVSCKPFTKKEEKSTAFQPTTFVLVHSAWLGSWQWDAVKQELEAAGHHVITPDLPGHGVSKILASEISPFESFLDKLNLLSCINEKTQ